MKFEWDDAKRLINLEKHHVDFIDVGEFFESPQVVAEDRRFDYQEKRWISYGLLRRRVMVCVYAQRKNMTRVISFRKANKNEVCKYEQAVKQASTL